MAEYFWLALVVSCLTWYSTVTIYVAIKGVADIKSMLRRLSQGDDLIC
ncbi:MAG TPA: hypothetical protein PK458_14395 [Phycisphaerae bacterium]|nr:hypothetical protein [Phycisphaerae bacterium]